LDFESSPWNLVSIFIFPAAASVLKSIFPGHAVERYSSRKIDSPMDRLGSRLLL
jgi:hypothetical protein